MPLRAERFEFTADLVPAWIDADLVPDTTGGNEHLYFTTADLQQLTDPDAETFYKYYHPRGSEFRRHVGRRWSLNESGKYSTAPPWQTDKYYFAGELARVGSHISICVTPHYSNPMNQPGRSSYWQSTAGYDRGQPFDFSQYIESKYVINSQGKRLFAPFNRQLLPCLTLDKDTLSSIGFKIEFSFDAGVTWQIIPASISALKEECGIYIEEPNLAELVDKKEGTISGGDLNGVQLNYWTSLCDDSINDRSFKNGQWNTRVRITASIQMDQRLRMAINPGPKSGSPFLHSQVYDFSEKYGLVKRTPMSNFYYTNSSAWQVDSTGKIQEHITAIRDANEDMSISGRFTLERLWLGDGAGQLPILIGDSIEKITGREYSLASSMGLSKFYPEIVKIVIIPDAQKMELITRDLRFATEVTL